MNVICESAGRLEACGECPHGREHDDQWPAPFGKTQTCRAIMACETDEETVRCVPVGAERKEGMNEVEQGGDGAEGKDNGKAKKRRKPYNYLLEKKALADELPVNAPAEGVWLEVEDGFVSPEAAIEHVSKARLTGTFRAVRVASAEYAAELTTPEPVLTVKKLKR